jgi:spore protease
MTEELSQELAKLVPDGEILVVGLGNNDITPDAIGPQTAAKIFATRHLREQYDRNEEEFLTSLRQVSSFAGGVMGQTGIETAEIVRAISAEIAPKCIIAVDALACSDIDRLGTTIQITDTGISPGSGVSNSRKELSEKVFGIPVIAVGVPTVVDMHTIVKNLTGRKINGELPNMLVTPRDIDRLTERASQLLAFGINLALHPTLTFEDVRGLF